MVGNYPVAWNRKKNAFKACFVQVLKDYSMLINEPSQINTPHY